MKPQVIKNQGLSRGAKWTFFELFSPNPGRKPSLSWRTSGIWLRLSPVARWLNRFAICPSRNRENVWVFSSNLKIETRQKRHVQLRFRAGSRARHWAGDRLVKEAAKFHVGTAAPAFKVVTYG